MDPDEDLLDQLDRREAGGPTYTIAVAGGLAALAATITYFTLKLELGSTTEIAGNAGALAFIVSAVLLGISRYRLR